MVNQTSKKSESLDKPFLLITGMHRSGTSFAARSFNLMGVYLGDINSLDSHEWKYRDDNLRGHWENKELLELGEKTLSDNNGSWYEIPAEINIGKEFGLKIKQVIQNLLKYQSIASGYKDPRALLYFDAWYQYLPQNTIIIGTFRHPLKVAESLKKRNNFTYDKSIKLWKEYNKKLLAILDNNKGFLLDFDWPQEKLLSEIQKIGDKLGLVTDINLSDWYSTTLLHSTIEKNYPIDNEIQDLYSQLQNRSKNNANINLGEIIHTDPQPIVSSLLKEIQSQGKEFKIINDANIQKIKMLTEKLQEYQARKEIAFPFDQLLLIYFNRPDLQNAFPEVLAGNYLNLLNWVVYTDFDKIGSPEEVDIIRKNRNFYSKQHTSLLGEAALDMQKNELLKQQSNQMQQKDELLKQQSDQMQQKDELLKQQSDQIQNLEQNLTSLEKAIVDERTNYDNLQSEILAIRSSTTWKSIKKFDKIIAKLCPPGSKRNRTYKLALIGINSIMNNGFVYTCKNVPSLLTSKSFHTSILETANQQHHLRLNRDLQYGLWRLQHRIDTIGMLARKRQIDDFKYKPKISIVMPVYNTDAKWLESAIESVRSQIYGNWELCIADDCSTNQETKNMLLKYKSDEQIKVKFLEKNLGIAGASNEALSLCSGDFVGFLDHDDEIYPDALFEVVKKLNNEPTLDILYSDEDKTNSTGDRFEPYFKPDWSPDLILSNNYMTHFLVVRREILSENKFRSKFDGAQDYDLILRLTEKTDKIGHISRPLYSWRQIKGSIAFHGDYKKYAIITSGKKALENALTRRSITGVVTNGSFPGYYHIIYDVKNEPKISVIIPTKDGLNFLKKCIESFEKTNYKNYEIIIVDNNSEKKETVEYLKSLKHKVLKFNSKYNFSQINNFAASKSTGDYLLFLNNDTEVIDPDWLREMMGQFANDKTGIVGNLLVFGNGHIQHGGVVVGFEGKAGHPFIGLLPKQIGYFGLHQAVRNCSAVTAACLLMKKKIFEEVGGFDETMPVAYNDVDLCLKVLGKGYNIVYTPHAKLIHHESATRGKFSPIEDAYLFNKKWNNFLKKGDPYYNQNLSLHYLYELKINEKYEPGVLVNGPTYTDISSYDKLLANQLRQDKIFLLKRQIDDFKYKPKISIVMPVYNTDTKWLESAIESVRSQIYGNWELCIADDCSTNQETKKVLLKYKSDEQIKVKFLEKNLGIAGASNEALSLCSGDFVGFLDHDDEIYPDALFEVVKKLNNESTLDILYSDEDKIEQDGRRVEPYFKPDWSPDLLLSQHYMAHFLVYRNILLKEIKGFRLGYDGSQDYDMILRATEKTKKIGHIPKVLYGWRKIPTSTALDPNAKSYTIDATSKLLNDMMKRRGINGKAERDPETGYNRIIYEIIENPLISIVIVTHDRPDFLKRLLDSIEIKSSYKNYEIIIVDRNSQNEETLKYLKTIKHKVLHYSGDFNYSKVLNYSVKYTAGKYLIFMNDDMEVINSDWIEALLEHSQQDDVGVVGNLLLYPKDNTDEVKIQHAGVVIGLHGPADHPFKNKRLSEPNYFNIHRVIRNCSSVTGACVMVKKRIFEEVGGWDENLAIVYNDVDFCLRVMGKGYRIVYTPYSRLYHYESATRGSLHPQHEEEYFLKKWESQLLSRDKYYNPNLTLLHESYTPSSFTHPNPAIAVMMEIYYAREDLQQVYPDAANGDYSNLVGWVLRHGVNEPRYNHVLRPYLSYYREFINELTISNKYE